MAYVCKHGIMKKNQAIQNTYGRDYDDDGRCNEKIKGT